MTNRIKFFGAMLAIYAWAACAILASTAHAASPVRLTHARIDAFLQGSEVSRKSFFSGSGAKRLRCSLVKFSNAEFAICSLDPAAPKTPTA